MVVADEDFLISTASLLSILPQMELAVFVEQIQWTADIAPVGLLELPVVLKR